MPSCKYLNAHSQGSLLMLRTWLQQGQQSPHSLHWLCREGFPWADLIPAAQGRIRRHLGDTAPSKARATCAPVHESLSYWTICSIEVFASKSLF